MRTDELQVGSWVMFNNKPCQVKGLHNDDTATFVGHRCLFYLIDAEPILITKELLEKNGFKRENLITSYNHYIGIDNRVSLNDDFYYINSRNTWHVHVDSEDYCTIANCELTYLHELQNLLRICKIDFEFVV
jgi:hypothetical protein